MFGMFYVVFFLVIAMFIFVFVKGISEWVHNNNSPRLSVDAKIVDKRSHTSHHHHNHNGHMHTSSSTLSKIGGKISGVEAVRKSYPGFFDDIKKLGAEVTLDDSRCK